MTGGSAGRLVEDAIRAREGGATRTFGTPTPFLGEASFLAVLLFQPRSSYPAGLGGEIVNDDDVVILCQGVCKVRADEAGPAGDDVAHEEVMAVGPFRGF